MNDLRTIDDEREAAWQGLRVQLRLDGVPNIEALAKSVFENGWYNGWSAHSRFQELLSDPSKWTISAADGPQPYPFLTRADAARVDEAQPKHRCCHEHMTYGFELRYCDLPAGHGGCCHAMEGVGEVWWDRHQEERSSMRKAFAEQVKPDAISG